MDSLKDKANNKIFFIPSELQIILKVKRKKIETPIDKIIAECDNHLIPRKIKKADVVDEINLNIQSLQISNDSNITSPLQNNLIFSRIINEEEKKGLLENPNKINIDFGDEVRVIKFPFSHRKKKEKGMKTNFIQKIKEDRIEQEFIRHKNELNNVIKSKRRQMEIFEEKLANIEKRRAEKLAKQKKIDEEIKEFKKSNQIAFMSK